jgi:hypothetical protein
MQRANKDVRTQCTVAKLRKVWDSAKKVEEKFGSNGKNAYPCNVKPQV